MTTFKAPICTDCVHLEKDATGFMQCEAFPGGIPRPIWTSQVEHRVSYPGDHGIHFEQGDPSWDGK